MAAFGSGTTVNANDNWWGTNNGPTGFTGNVSGGVVTAADWLELKLAASATPITAGQTSILTASFLSDSANNTISASNLGPLTGLGVTWTSGSFGTLSNQQITIQNAGTATATFTAVTGGVDAPTAQVDNVPAATTNITIQPTVTTSNGSLATNTISMFIAGTGFDTTANHNTVTFNNGTGVVASATNTQLTVTVTGLVVGSLTAIVTTNGVSSGPAVQVASIVATTNTGLSVVEGTSARITSGVLAAETADLAGSFTYTLTAIPTHGILITSTNVILAVNSTFTQADINNGTIFYENDASGADASSDSFSFTVADSTDAGVGSGVFTFTITEAPTTIAANSGASVAEGGTVTLSNPVLAATRDAGDPATESIYTITAAPSHGTLKLNNVALAVNGTFTQADVNTGKVTYTSNAGSDSFSFSVTDSPGAPATGTFSFTVTDPMGLVNNGLAGTENSLQTITSALLSADADDAPSTVVYTLVSTPSNGTLKNGATTLALNGTFTQADINSGKVTYTGADGADSFQFTVSDSDGGSVGATTFSITLAESNDLTVTPTPVSANANAPFSGQVATFNDGGDTEPASAFTAMIHWGDAAGSATDTVGDVSQPGGSGHPYVVTAASHPHTYTQTNSFTFTVTVKETGIANGTASSNGTATVMAVTGAIVVTGTNGDDTLIVTTTGPDSGSYSLNGGPAIPFTGATSFTFNGLGGNDTLIVHNPVGGLFGPSGGVAFNGGTGHNAVQVLDGAVVTEVFDYAPNAADGGHNGSFSLVKGPLTAVYTYTELSPILVNAGTPNDVIFNLPNNGLDNQFVLQAGAPGMSQVLSQAAGFETTTFANPAQTVTINVAGSVSQTLHLTALPGAVIRVNGGGGLDLLDFDAKGQPVGVVTGALTALGHTTVAYAKICGLTIENAAGVNALYGPDTVDRATAFIGLNAQERFVQALYLDALGRAGTKAELDGWAAVFGAPALSQTNAQTAIAASIEHSTEARDHLVQSWYATYLGRAASGGEEQGWVNALLAGQNEETVLSGFLATPEFYARAQTLSATGSADERYVQALYLLLLNRTGEASGVAGWVGALPSQGRQGVALAFLTGPTDGEFRAAQFEGYYNALLHRPSDSAGLNGWVFANVDIGTVRLGFESTPEFFTNG